MTPFRHLTMTLPAVVWAVVVSLVVCPARVRAADPTSEILRLVPPETRICLVVRDLRTHLRAIEGSPFEKWLESSPIGKRLTDPLEMAKIEQLESFLKENFGVGFDRLLDDVLGDAVVLAYQPGPAGHPEQEMGVVFINARDPELLASLIDKLNELQKKSGEIKSVREATHQGQKYFSREKAAGDREYYLVRRGILAFSGQEKAIKNVIEQDARPAEKGNRVADGIAALGLKQECAVCWFDPRGFDADVKVKIEAAQDLRERAFLTQFARVWNATDGIAVYAHPGRGMELGIVASFDREKMPKEVRDLTFPDGQGSPLWTVVPEDAILAFGGRLDILRLKAGLDSFLPPEGKTELQKAIDEGLAPIVGRDKLQAVVAGLGPDWIVWLTPPPKRDSSYLPEWTAALKLSNDGKGNVDVGKSVLQVVDFGVQMGRIAYNREHIDQIDLNEVTHDGASVKVLSNSTGFPLGFQPSYGIIAGHFVVASSPDAAFRFKAPAGPIARPETLLMRFAPGRLRNYLIAHRAEIVKATVRWSGKPATNIEQELDELSAVLEAFDQVELRQTSDEGKVRLSLQIDFIKPLKK